MTLGTPYHKLHVANFMLQMVTWYWVHRITNCMLLISCSPLYVWACVCMHSAMCQRPVSSHMNELRIQLTSSTLLTIVSYLHLSVHCTCTYMYICSAQVVDLRYFEIALRILEIAKMPASFEITCTISRLRRAYTYTCSMCMANPLLELARSCQCC